MPDDGQTRVPIRSTIAIELALASHIHEVLGAVEQVVVLQMLFAHVQPGVDHRLRLGHGVGLASILSVRKDQFLSVDGHLADDLFSSQNEGLQGSPQQ